MTAATILEIIRLSLVLTLEIVKNIPPEQQAAFWDRHEARMERWDALLQKVRGETA